MRYAIWAAVSTAAQARKDKVSLDDQLADCRTRAAEHGWTESAGPFIVSGASRSRWINLSDAARALPALGDLIRSAQRREFDLLLCWDTTRFRDLLTPVHRFLDDQRIQLYSLAQPIEPVSAETYDPRENDTAEILYDVNAMSSRLESKHKQRRWRSGVTGRIQAGLHFARIPFGYRKPPGREFDRQAVLEPDPVRSRLLQQAVEKFLAGWSLQQLTDFVSQSGIDPPVADRWHYTTLRRILLNPFYSGLVFFGRQPTRRDRFTGRTLLLPSDPSRMVRTRGRHTALWDEATQARILAEFKRRGRAHTGKTTHTLSRLLRCAACGHVLWYKDNRTSLRGHAGSLFWRCSTAIRTRGARGHAHIRDDKIKSLLITAMQQALRKIDELPVSGEGSDQRLIIRTEITALAARRQRWTDAFETGTLQPEAFAERIQDLETRLAAAARRLEEIQQTAADQKRRRRALEDLASIADGIPGYIRDRDPQEVNTTLHELLVAVHVGRDGSIKLEWKL